MSITVKEKILDLKSCINQEAFATFKDCSLEDVFNQEEYYKSLISTIGLYASVHPQEYLDNKDEFYSIVLELDKTLSLLREQKINDGDFVESSALEEDPTNSQLLANNYGTALYLFCAIDTMNQGKFNFNYFKGKYPRTTLRSIPLNNFSNEDIKISVACETDKKLYDNFVESNLTLDEKMFIIETLDGLNIRGPELRQVVRAVCSNNFKKVLILCKLLENEKTSEFILKEFINNINANQTAHSTFKASKLAKIDNNNFLDLTRPILTKLDTVKEEVALLHFSDYLDLIPEEIRDEFDILKPFLNEDGSPIKLNETEISDYDIRAIFTKSEILNLENLLKDPYSFNLYLSRVCLELRNYEETSITPIVLDKINLGEKQIENAKRKTRIYSLKDPDICVLDYIESSQFKPEFKLFLTKNVLLSGKNKVEDCLTTLINLNILNKNVDKLIEFTCSKQNEDFFEVCEILKEPSVLQQQIIASIFSDNDKRSLEQIKQDIETSKLDLDAMQFENQFTTQTKDEPKELDLDASQTSNSEQTELANPLSFLLTEEELEELRQYTSGLNKTNGDSDEQSPTVNEDDKNTSETIENNSEELFEEDNNAPFQEETFDNNTTLSDSKNSSLNTTEELLDNTFEEDSPTSENSENLNTQVNSEEVSFNQPNLEKNLSEHNFTNPQNFSSTESTIAQNDSSQQTNKQPAPSEENLFNNTIVENLGNNFVNPAEEPFVSHEEPASFSNDPNSSQEETDITANGQIAPQIEPNLQNINPVNNSQNPQIYMQPKPEQQMPAAQNDKLQNPQPNNMGFVNNQPNNMGQQPFMPNQNYNYAPNYQQPFMPFYNPYFNPYQNMSPEQFAANQNAQNMFMQQQMQPFAQNPQANNAQMANNGQVAQNGQPMQTQPQMPNMFPFGYPYPFFPNMMPMQMPATQPQQNTPAQTQEKNAEQPAAEKKEKPKQPKPRPAVKQYVSRAQKLEEAFFKDMNSPSSTTEPELNENDNDNINENITDQPIKSPVEEIQKPIEEPENTVKERNMQVKEPENAHIKESDSTSGSGERVQMSEADFFADL